MFIAMNRFKIAPGFEAGFEKIWRERETFLHTVQIVSVRLKKFKIRFTVFGRV